MCSEWHYTTREIGGWRHDNEPVGQVVMSPYANPRVFISYLPNTHLLKPFIARDFMEGHICRQNRLIFALVFCFELRARATRTCCHCHLQAAVKNPIHDGKRGQKKSHEQYHNVVM